MTTPVFPSRNSIYSDLLDNGYRYAYGITRCRYRAEDLVHDAWLKIFRCYGRVDCQALLYRTVKNLFIDECRRQRIASFESLDQMALDIPLAVSTQYLGLECDLELFLAALRPCEREVIFLHYHRGHTAAEIGELTSRPRGTVLCLLHRAMAKLKATRMELEVSRE